MATLSRATQIAPDRADAASPRGSPHQSRELPAFPDISPNTAASIAPQRLVAGPLRP